MGSSKSTPIEVDNSSKLNNAVTINESTHDYMMILLNVLAGVKILEITIFAYRQFIKAIKKKYSNEQVVTV